MAKKYQNTDITISGVGGFSREEILKYKTEKDFLEAMNHKTYSHLFEGENREKSLKELYALAQPKNEPAANDTATKPKK